MGQMALQEMTGTSTTIVSMVPTRSVWLNDQWEAIWMVWLFMLLTATVICDSLPILFSVLVNIISSLCINSTASSRIMRSCQHLMKSLLLLGRGSWMDTLKLNTWKKKTWKSIRKHQESIGRSKSVGHHKWRLFTRPLGAYGLIDRDCGTRKCSSSFLLNGLLHATSHLMSSKNLSLLCWWTSHIIQVVNWRFHNVMPLSRVWWRWARK